MCSKSDLLASGKNSRPCRSTRFLRSSSRSNRRLPPRLNQKARKSQLQSASLPLGRHRSRPNQARVMFAASRSTAQRPAHQPTVQTSFARRSKQSTRTFQTSRLNSKNGRRNCTSCSSNIKAQAGLTSAPSCPCKTTRHACSNNTMIAAIPSRPKTKRQYQATMETAKTRLCLPMDPKPRSR